VDTLYRSVIPHSEVLGSTNDYRGCIVNAVDALLHTHLIERYTQADTAARAQQLQHTLYHRHGAMCTINDAPS